MTAVYSIIRKSEAINRDQPAKESLEEGNPLLDAREAVMDGSAVYRLARTAG